MIKILDQHNNVVSQSANLRGLRRATGTYSVHSVHLNEEPTTIKVIFKNGFHCTTNFASFTVLKDTVKNWRNLYGSNLVINGVEFGVINKQTKKNL